MEKAVVAAVTHDTSEAKITIAGVPDRPGVAATVFRKLADSGANLDMIVQNVSVEGATDISFTVPKDELGKTMPVAQSAVGEIGATSVTADGDIAKVSVVGAGMKYEPGVAATMFETLAREEVNIEMISTSSIRISCVIRAEDVERAVQCLHTAYELDV